MFVCLLLQELSKAVYGEEEFSGLSPGISPLGGKLRTKLSTDSNALGNCAQWISERRIRIARSSFERVQNVSNTSIDTRVNACVEHVSIVRVYVCVRDCAYNGVGICICTCSCV